MKPENVCRLLVASALLLVSSVLGRPRAVEAEVLLPTYIKCRETKSTRSASYTVQLKFEASPIVENEYVISGSLVKRARNDRLLTKYALAGTWNVISDAGLQVAGLPTFVQSKKEYGGLLAMGGSLESGRGTSRRPYEWLLKIYRADSRRPALTMHCTQTAIRWPQGDPTPTPAPTAIPQTPLSTDNWAGTWGCIGPGDATLTITGQGVASKMTATFATAAYGPASDDYTFEEIALYSAGGTYIYHNQSPPYNWPGAFSLTLRDYTIFLERQDLSSSWHGSYLCSAK